MPVPSTSAPIRVRKRHSSATCGSQAACRISLTPGAAAAASRAVSVPVTDASTRYTEVGRRPSGASSTKSPPRSVRRRPPMASSACRWADNVRRAGKSPPGGARRTRPRRASRGPHRSTEPRSRPTRSRSGTSPVTSAQSTRRVAVPSPSITAPSPRSRSDITCTSLMRGVLVRTHARSVRRQAASNGSAAFLLPSTSIRPSRRWPPSTTRLVRLLPTGFAMSSFPCPGAARLTAPAGQLSGNPLRAGPPVAAQRDRRVAPRPPLGLNSAGVRASPGNPFRAGPPVVAQRDRKVAPRPPLGARPPRQGSARSTVACPRPRTRPDTRPRRAGPRRTARPPRSGTTR